MASNQSHLQRIASAVLIAALIGCAAQRAKNCADLAGANWTPMASAPANATELLAQQGMPNDSQTIWFTAGAGKLLACIDAPGLTDPSCAGATVYQFQKTGNRWAPSGTAMSHCEY